jgi:hypothetical protein
VRRGATSVRVGGRTSAPDAGRKRGRESGDF